MRRHALTVGLVLVLSMLGTGCSGDPYESAAEKTVSKTKDMVKIMQGIKTDADAQAAVPKLEAIAKDFDAISADLKKQPKMTADQKKKVKKVFDDAKKDMEALKKKDGRPSLSPDAGMKLSGAAMKVMGSMMQVAMQLESQNF